MMIYRLPICPVLFKVHNAGPATVDKINYKSSWVIRRTVVEIVGFFKRQLCAIIKGIGVSYGKSLHDHAVGKSVIISDITRLLNNDMSLMIVININRTRTIKGGGAFCRSLHQIGQCASGKMRHNASKCFIIH